MSANSAEFTLSVDRTIVEEGKSLELSFSYDDNVRGDSPDFSELSKNFDVLNIYPSSQRYNINGKKSILNQWVLHVIPKKKGSLLIPPITFKGKSTKPVRVEVKASGSVGQSQDVFLETIINKSSAYIGEGIKLSYRLYYDAEIDNPQTDKLEISGVDIQEMPTNQYSRRVDGRLYNVAEFNYLLTSSQDGTVVIPKMNWRIRVSKGGGQSLFDRFGRYEIVQHRTQEKIIRIKSIPASYPKDTPWLPAKSLSIEQSWSQPTEQMNVGVPNTRKISIQAEGLKASKLPVLMRDYSDTELKIYAESPELEDNFDNSGPLGKSTQNAAVIVNTSNSTVLPEIQVAWWNTEADVLEYATLPEQILTANSAQIPTTPLNGKKLLADHSSSEQTNISEPDDIEKTQVNSTGPTERFATSPWLIILLVFSNLLTLGLCVYFFLRSRRQDSSLQRHLQEQPSTIRPSDLLKQITHAEKQGAWDAVYELITQYSQLNLGLNGFDALKAKAKSSGLVKLHERLCELENSLYSRSNRGLQANLSFSADLKQIETETNKNKAQADTNVLFPN